MPRLTIRLAILVTTASVLAIATDGGQSRVTLRAQTLAPPAPASAEVVRSFDGRTMRARRIRVVVPERYENPSGSVLTVSAVHFPSTAARPSRPIVFLMGGPGIPDPS